MKKLFLNFLFFVSIFSFQSNFAKHYDYDDFDVFSDDDLTMNSLIDDIDPDMSKQNSSSSEILDLLIKEFDVDRILRRDFFLRTHPLNTRRLLDNPLFFMDKDYGDGRWVLDFHLFYDQTSRMHFTRKCIDHKCKDKIASGIYNYLAIKDCCLIQELERLKEKVDEIYPGLDYNVRRILSLFNNTKIQERRAGLFMGFMAKVRKLHIKLQMPFYYVIRNFFLNCKERKAIEKELGPVNPGETNEAEALAFARKHLVSDRLGLGDLRFSVDYPIDDDGGIDLRLGLFADIPTSVSMVKGLYGEVFCPIKKRPTINFARLIDLVGGGDQEKEQADSIVRCFGLNVLDGISSMLVDTHLGNRRHFGLGIYLRTYTPLRVILNRRWTQNLFFKGRISFEYMFPSKECRWFIEKCNPAEFNRFDKYRSTDSVDEEVADQDLAFLERKFVDMVFPYVYEATARPGFIFMWTSKLTYEARRWGIHLGSDAWVQTKESLSEVCCPAYQKTLLNIEKARKPWAFQWTVLGSIFFKSKRKKSSLYIGLNGEKTISSTGIGKPFKVSLSFERNF